MQERFNVPEIEYERGRSNIFDIFDGKTQCLSGTGRYAVLRNKVAGAHPEKVEGQHPVILFTNGHVLPGYFLRENGQWVLYGVETTEAGQSDYRVADAKDLSGEAIRIVLVRDFLLSELLEDGLSAEERAKFRDGALARVAKVYDLPLAQMEAQVAKEAREAEGTDTELVGRIFGFGKADVKAGAKPRIYRHALARVSAIRTEYLDQYKEVPNPNWNSTMSPGYRTLSVKTGKQYKHETEAMPELFSALAAQDEAAVKRLLAGGENPNVWCRESFDLRGQYVGHAGAPLHIAIATKNLTNLRALLEHGADPFAATVERWGMRSEQPAIYFAIDEDNGPALKEILRFVKSADRHVSPSAKSFDGRPYLIAYNALAYAVQTKKSEAITLLRAAGARPDAKVDADMTVKEFADFLVREFKIPSSVGKLLE